MQVERSSVAVSEPSMEVLPDIVAPGLAVLLCGTAVPCAAARGHYHAGRGDGFWSLLHEAGFTPQLLTPYDDETLPSFGVGLTDLVPMSAARPRAAYDVARLVDTVAAVRPQWLAFTSKAAGQAAARELGQHPPGLGLADWRVAEAAVFVLPSASGANRRRDYDGRATRLAWWGELQQLAAVTAARAT